MKQNFAIVVVFATCAIARAEDSKWFMNYYKKPSPEAISQKIEEWHNSGGLSETNAKPVFIGFLSAVMSQNPELVGEWLTISEKYPEEEQHVVRSAAWFSRTETAKEYFYDKKLDAYIEKEAPKILEMEINHPSVLDMLWAYYFAIGEDKAIRRLISALEYQMYSGALEKYEASEKTEKDKQEAMYDAIFGAAMWSLESNCRQDERIKNICHTFLWKDDVLTKPEQMYLAIVLSKVSPEEVEIKIDDNP